MDSYLELENNFCAFTNKRYAVSCNTGTSGLHLALLALGIGEGDEVIIPDFTMSACAFAVSYTGAKVVTVDCGDDYNMRHDLIKVTPNTKAIMAVHIYGRNANVAGLKKFGLPIIEDMSEGHGIIPKGDIAVYSLYKNKIIHAEEGGIVVTNDKDYADTIRDLKNMAFGDKHNFYHERVGYNYRMSDAQAKIALKSLDKFGDNRVKRRQVASWYDEIFERKHDNECNWVYDFEVEDNSIVDKIPEARYFFKPISTFPMYTQQVGKKALEISKRGMYLPIYPDMTKKDTQDLARLVKSMV